MTPFSGHPSRFEQRLDSLQVLLQARAALVVRFAQSDVDAVQQVLQGGVVEQGFDVRALVVPGSNCIAMFIGAAIAEIFRRRQQEGLVVPVASGLIAGESLMGVVVALMVAGGAL